jgi:solute carrier family 25 (adenine nucleotide translocator) protein 4/5/6/31
MATSSFIYDFMMGGLSAAIAKTATAPIEKVKLVLQVQNVHPDLIGQGIKYNHLSECMAGLVEKQGVIALWDGNLVNIIRYFPTQLLNFMFKGSYKRMFAPKDPKNASYTRKLIGNVIAGGLAGATTLLFIYPLDVVRMKLAVDIGEKRLYNGICDCLWKTVLDGGISALYAGFLPAFAGVFAYRASYFLLYDSLKGVIQKTSSVTARFLLLQLLVAVSGLITYPLDTLRRREMISTEVRPDSQGILDLPAGQRGYFGGAVVNVLKGVTGALSLVAYDSLRRKLA